MYGIMASVLSIVRLGPIPMPEEPNALIVLKDASRVRQQPVHNALMLLLRVDFSMLTRVASVYWLA